MYLSHALGITIICVIQRFSIILVSQLENSQKNLADVLALTPTQGKGVKKITLNSKNCFKDQILVIEVKKRSLTWAGHVWWKIGSIIRLAIEKKRPLERLRLCWEDCVKADVGRIRPDIQ